MSQPFEPSAGDSVYELYPIPCVKKRTRKIVRVPERLYHLLLIHFYQSRYDYAVCTPLKVYPKSLGLSRELYPISALLKKLHSSKTCHLQQRKREKEPGAAGLGPLRQALSLH